LYIDTLDPREQEAIKTGDPWTMVRERMTEITADAGKIASLCRELGVKALNAPLILTREPLYAALCERELPWSIWTVNDSSEILRLLKEEVCNITTRAVKTAVSLRESLYN